MVRGNQGKFQYTIVSSNVSPRSLSTLRKIQQKRRKSVRQGTTCAFYDNSSPVYDWLLPGWLAEERVVESGRLYRYYYDSTGKFYETKQEVLYAYDCIGVIDLNA